MSNDPLATFKAAQRAGWAHFTPLQAITTEPAAQLVKFAGIRSGQRVLDVACGTGVVSVTAARLGARVTGLDLTPELLAAARDNARIASVDVEWHEGDVEALPFDPDAFDVVVSQYGHMFGPRPDVTLREMLRVLKPGGVIAFSTWPPELFVGRVFALTAKYMPPPPPGVSPPGGGSLGGIRRSCARMVAIAMHLGICVGSIGAQASSRSSACGARHRGISGTGAALHGPGLGARTRRTGIIVAPVSPAPREHHHSEGANKPWSPFHTFHLTGFHRPTRTPPNPTRGEPSYQNDRKT